jgi:formate dehydrogenase major subunit
MARAVVPPPGDARQDWWIIQEMARRLGLAWTYQGPADVFAEMSAIMPSLAHISWARLEREGAVTYPALSDDHPGESIIFGDHFPTPSGRARIVPARIAPPDEVPDADYPMILSTGRVLEHWHTGSMTRRTTILDQLEPEAIALMNPIEITHMGARPGDAIRIETRRGAVTTRVREDRDVPRGMIFLPFCYAEAAANLLTNPALDPAGKIPEFKFCAAKAKPEKSQ